MCGRLDYFLNTFAKLRTDGSKKNWTSLTYNRSPYKPFLLLAVLDFIESGIIVRNFIEPSFELAQLFQSYCDLLLPPERKSSMSYPFYHLESAVFWELKPLRWSNKSRLMPTRKELSKKNPVDQHVINRIFLEKQL